MSARTKYLSFGLKSPIDLQISLKMKTICSSETLVFIYKSIQRLAQNTNIDSKLYIFRFRRIVFDNRQQLIILASSTRLKLQMLFTGKATLNVHGFIFSVKIAAAIFSVKVFRGFIKHFQSTEVTLKDEIRAWMNRGSEFFTM